MTTHVRLLIAGVLVAGAVAGVASDARAQSDTLRVQKPFRIKVGGFFPSDGDLKDALGENFFSYGLSYDFGKSTATNPSIYSVYYDGNYKSRRGNRISYNAVGATVRFLLNPATEGTRFYAGPGLGAYFIGSRGGGRSETDTRIGGKLFAGVELNNGLFGELDYTIVGEVDGISPNGINASLGYRF